MKGCNGCEHKKVRFNGTNNHYVVCGMKNLYVGYCRRGTTGLYRDIPPEWCPLKKQAEVRQ